MKGAIILTLSWQIQQGWASLLHFIIARVKLWDHKDEQPTDWDAHFSLDTFKWMPSLWWVRLERVSFCPQPPFPQMCSCPCSGLGSLGCLSTLQRIAEQLCHGEGPGSVWSCGPGHPLPALSEPRSLWRTPLCLLVSMACAFWCHSLLGKVSLGLVGLALAGCGYQASCKHNLCAQGNQALVFTWHFLGDLHQSWSHPCVLERCFQPSDPIIAGLTGSLLRGPLCVSSWCTTSSMLALEMGTGTNTALAPSCHWSWGSAVCTDHAGLMSTTHLHCPHTSEALVSAQWIVCGMWLQETTCQDLKGKEIKRNAFSAFL